MKKQILTLLLVVVMMFGALPLMGVSAAEEIITFPDANFTAVVRSLIGKTHGEDIYKSDVEGITYLTVPYQYIADLTGIEYFTALTSLACNSNPLTELDISN